LGKIWTAPKLAGLATSTAVSAANVTDSSLVNRADPPRTKSLGTPMEISLTSPGRTK